MSQYSLGVAQLGTEVDLSGLKSGLKSGEGMADGGAAKIGAVLSSGLGVGVAAAGAVVVGGLAAIGVTAFNVASQTNDATNEIQAQLGATAEEADALKDAALGVFGNNFGDSIADATQGLIDTRKQMKGLAEDELQQATESAFALRDVFGYEIPESTNAANALMEKFGLTSEQAFDMIAKGAQSGLDNSGDMLESFGEYSTVFAAAGFSAEQMYSIMETGAEAGVLGTDKIADSIKEMGIRLNEGGDEVEAGFEAIGLSYTDLQAQVAAGETTWGDQFDTIVGGLRSIEDPIARNAAQVAIFGTMAEDLGVNFTDGLSAATTSLNDMGGATDALNAKYNNFGSMFEGLKRQMLLALEPLGAKLLEIANAIMPHVEAAFAWLGAQLPVWIDMAVQAIDRMRAIFNTLAEAFADGGVLGVLQTALQGLISYVEGQLPVWRQRLTSWANALWQWIQDAIPPMLQKAGAMIGQLLAYIAARLPDWIAAMLRFGTEAVKWMADALPKLLLKAAELLSALLEWAYGTALPKIVEFALKFAVALYEWVTKELIPKIGPELAKFLDAVIEFLVNMATAAGQSALEIGRGIVSGIAQAIRNGAGAVGDALRGVVDGAISSIKAKLGIQSPSRVLAAEVGQPMIEGVAMGFEDQARRAAAQMGLTMRGVVSSLQGHSVGMAAIGSSAAMGAGISGGANYDNHRSVVFEAGSIVAGERPGETGLELLRALSARGLA